MSHMLCDSRVTLILQFVVGLGPLKVKYFMLMLKDERIESMDNLEQVRRFMGYKVKICHILLQ